MKIEFHIQPEQFEYIGFDYDTIEQLTDELIERGIEDYRRAKRAVKGGDGLPKEEFDLFLDRMLSGDTNHLETYNRMTLGQQEMVQALKRSKKRIAYKLSNSKE